MRNWILLFLILPFLALGPILLSGKTIGPFDHVAKMVPGAPAATPNTAWDVLPIDGVLQFYPWRDLVFQGWRAGEIPLWNPYVLAGTPLLANSQSGAIYPLHVLAGLSGLPTGLAINLLAYLHLFWAGLGVFFLARKLGADEIGAGVGGASFVLSPFLLSWVPLASVGTTVAWIPWMLYGVATIAGGERRGLAWMAGSGAMMILAGHLQFVAYGFLAAALLGLALRPKLAGILQIGLGLGLSALMAAPHLSAVLAYSQFSHRRNVASEEGYQAYVAGGIRPFELANLVNPLSLGSPRLPMQSGSELSTYWPAFAKLGGNFAESAVSPGALVVLGLLFLPFVWSRLKGTERERGIIACGVVAVFALLMATGTPVNRLFYFGVPGWSSTGSPGRAAVIFALLACVAAAIGLRSVAELSPKDRAFRFGLLAFILVGFLTLGLGTTSQVPALPQLAEPLKAAAAIAAGIALPITFLTLLIAGQAPLMASLPAAKKYAPVIWVGMVPVLALLWGASSIVPSGTPFPATAVPTTERHAFINQNWSLFGGAPGAINVPNLAIYSRARDIAGYDSLLHLDTKALLDGINGKDSAPEANGNMMFIKPGFDPEKLAEAGVTRVNGEPLAGPGRVSLAAGSARIISESLNSVAVEVSGAGELTLRDRMMPGWQYRLDNGNWQPVPESATWRVVSVPAGTTKVTFQYSPIPVFAWGAMALGWLLLLALALPRRSPNDHHEPTNA